MGLRGVCTAGCLERFALKISAVRDTAAPRFGIRVPAVGVHACAVSVPSSGLRPCLSPCGHPSFACAAGRLRRSRCCGAAARRLTGACRKCPAGLPVTGRLRKGGLFGICGRCADRNSGDSEPVRKTATTNIPGHRGASRTAALFRRLRRSAEETGFSSIY